METTVILSPRYQISIPRNVRESLMLTPGAKLKVRQHEGRIELVPARGTMRGFLRGMDTHFEREPDRV
jgi:AbrB family looped-hinge helix DNA binding protein